MHDLRKTLLVQRAAVEVVGKCHKRKMNGNFYED